MAESKLRNLSVEFSVKIIKLCESIKGHYSLTNQLERSGTSIGANIHEANSVFTISISVITRTVSSISYLLFAQDLAEASGH